MVKKYQDQIGQNIVRNKIRYDLEIISDLIKPKSKILDIGCSDGELLKFLKKNKKTDCYGLEVSQKKVSESLSKGLSVIQGDAEVDLEYYPDQHFDYAILSQTIQATSDPKKILEEMLRIAKYAIISLPNFANIKNRLQLLFKGKMPVSESLPYEWYNTPNIHFCSISDFEDLCAEMNLEIKEKVFLTSKHKLINFAGTRFFANLFAEYGIFLITQNTFAPTHQEEFIFNKNIEKELGYSFSMSQKSRFLKKLPKLLFCRTFRTFKNLF
jgi:methionine biosynthesis protein MetW